MHAPRYIHFRVYRRIGGKPIFNSSILQLLINQKNKNSVGFIKYYQYIAPDNKF